jgi:hypothetical protein
MMVDAVGVLLACLKGGCAGGTLPFSRTVGGVPHDPESMAPSTGIWLHACDLHQQQKACSGRRRVDLTFRL